MNNIQLIKNRSDIGAGTRGSDMGIDAIEIAAINARSDYFTRFPFVDVGTHNETIYNKVNALFAKRIEYVHEQCERVTQVIHQSLSEGFFPIVLSGDHSSALGTMSGIKAQYPDKRLGAVWIDAHADLHSPFTTPSGNVHGMPLAAALSADNLDRQVNEVTPETQAVWSKLKNLGVDKPKVLPDDLVFFGLRDTEEPEEHLMEVHNIRNYRVDEIRYRGLETCLKEARERLAGCDIIYISFDVDSMDCDMVSRGTGTPVPKGFDPQESIDIIKGIFDSGKVICFEITEVNPLLDTKGNKMAETAFEVLDKVTSYYLEKVD